MSVESTQIYSQEAEALTVLHESEVQDFLQLLDVFPEVKTTPERAEAHVRRAIESDTTTVFAVRHLDDNVVASSATLNRLPTIYGEGSVMWIDDVMTHPDHMQKGLSKKTMNAMEAEASKHSDDVRLTSSPDRGPARSGYYKRGYELFPGGLAVYRNTDPNTNRVDNTEMLTDYTSSDLEALGRLYTMDPEHVEFNLKPVLESKYSAVFVRKREGAIAAVAIANLCPIPVGLKPWIDDLTSYKRGDQWAVVNASEEWLVANGAPYTNIVASSEEKLTDGYEKRTSGLFIKDLVETQS